MTVDTKEQIKSTSKTLGVVAIGAGIVGTVAYLVLPPTGKTITLGWDYIPTLQQAKLSEVMFEFVSRTNINSPWQFCTNVVGTNRVTLPNNKPQEFFTISKVMRIDDTNNQIRQIGF